MANNSTTQRLQEKWEKITLRFFRNHANRQKLLETVAFLDESEGVLRSNNIPINRLRGLIERSGRSLITRNIRKITHNVIYAQYFICPPPFIQVERAFSNHVQYRFVIGVALEEASLLLSGEVHVSYYLNIIKVSLLLNLAQPV